MSNKTAGFTLIETIIYIGLFSLMFSGIFVSIYPLFSGAERMTRNIAGEGETAFILSKIDYALDSVITNPGGQITSPAEGMTANELILSDATGERFRFVKNEDNEFCATIPLECDTLTQSENEGDALPLNTQRVRIEGFTATHGKDGDVRFVEVSFRVNGASEKVGPIRYYTHF